ncbi:MAG: hypothetical protein K8I30_03590, partial [Anaerolineae bacterium]|nr:hypothetical protein [Anaerolineae bacterium]
MEQLSGYEIAQQRIEGRQKQRFRAGIGFAMFFLLIVLTLLAGPQASACLIPLMVCFGFFALIGGIQLYYASPRGAPSAAVVETEMGWLFGDDWRDVAGTDEFILAQERIRQRRTKRAYFFLHLIIFLLVNAALIPPLLEAVRLMSSGWPRYFLLMFPLVWLGVLGKRASE